ncbi:hypothetical protein M9H77_03532 [Catharanthus roseus]|uniref:Uncharacterized protein n=1 Tax=Catharanthus roseus TaxID=4058 RepID=A0ACC0CBZ6_CATRO|nr:hypothetical protein M9H77_03532 [Catharanthus roseus]
MKVHSSTHQEHKVRELAVRKERERDRGRRLLLIPSRLRPFFEGFNTRSSFSLPLAPRRDIATARRPFSGVCFSNKWYQSRGSSSSAPASDSNFSDPAIPKIETDGFDGKSDFVMCRRKMKAVLVQNKIAPAICSLEEYLDIGRAKFLKKN